MLKKQIIHLICLFYVSNCLARSFRPDNINYDYRVQARRQSFKSVTTTPRPILQQYWQSFVSNLPTLPPISWNITNLIGSIFNGNTVKDPNRRKTAASKLNNKKRKVATNYLYDNSYQQMHLQPLVLDYNRIMHFYEPSTGLYYALQVDSQPAYYNGQYGNPYNKPYAYDYNQYNNYGGSYEDNNSSDVLNGYYYENDPYNSENGYDTAERYDSHQQYYSDNGSEFSGFADEKDPTQQDNMEYDDGVDLADNWGYNDEDIFADRKFKGEANKLDTIAERIIKIQKHFLKSETEDDVKHLLSK